jgi:mRNA interferase MazF
VIAQELFLCVPLTSDLKWAEAPGNVRLTMAESGLQKESVANTSLIALDKSAAATGNTTAAR